MNTRIDFIAQGSSVITIRHEEGRGEMGGGGGAGAGRGGGETWQEEEDRE